MEYTILRLAKLAGISTRTLRHYDEIGLLKPLRISSSGYRIYGPHEVDALQQILFFRELGFSLPDIKAAMDAGTYDRLATLRGHLHALNDRRRTLDALIANVEQTITSMERSIPMTDQEKFEGLKQRAVDENEAKYGDEIRKAYGEETVNQSNKRYLSLSEAEHARMQSLAQEIITALQTAVRAGADPKGAEGERITGMHREWLGFTWPKYTAEAHRGLAQMYVDDPRFTVYYDGEQPGCAQFLRDAVHAWAK